MAEPPEPVCSHLKEMPSVFRLLFFFLFFFLVLLVVGVLCLIVVLQLIPHFRRAPNAAGRTIFDCTIVVLHSQ